MTITVKRLGLLVLAALSLVAFVAPAAHAEFGLTHVGGLIKASPSGESATAAASHPWDAAVTVKLNETGGFPDESVKDVDAVLPPGLIGNPSVIPALCGRAELAEPLPDNPLLPNCPTDSQVGVVHVNITAGLNATLPVFSLVPQPGAPAQFGFLVLTTPVIASAELGSRAENYALHVNFADVSQSLGLRESTMTLWGVPADPSHDALRMTYCLPDPSGFCLPGHETTAPPRPFITIPSDCSAGPLTTTVRADSWQNPGAFVSSSFDEDENGNPTAVEGCAEVPFAPRLEARPSSRAAAAPTGLEVDLTMPTEGLENPVGTAESPLKDVSVTLPRGMTVNDSSAEGLSGCAPAQIEIETAAAATCPDAAKIGSVEITTPLLDHALPGSVYLATQGSNPFNSLLALYIAVDDPQTGVVVKLPGKVSADPATGQLTATFTNNPQLPFEKLHLELKSGSRAPLVAPSACGTYSTHVEMTSWARPGEAVVGDSSFTIDQNCGNSSQFTPGLEAGTTNPAAGKYSPFTLRVTRPDGQQNVSQIEATLPKGVLAKLAGVPLCADAQAASGNCPASTQVGSATVGAGAGSTPLYVPQPGKAPTAVYLAGPYKGAPYSLVVKVPAQAGPFDLGTVAVRNALHVDPTSAQVTATSDPLPQILQGIPISYRDIRVDVDRPDFTLNPTSCDPMAVTSTITSAGGAVATPSSHFQVGSCERLAFGPKLSLQIKGGHERGDYQRLKAVLTQPKGQANIGKVSVAMPHSVFLAQEHINTICTRPQFAENSCPKGSIYGKARAFTPLLDQPLEGPVYLRANGGARELPDLVADLKGQIEIELVGYIDSVDGGIRTRFQNVPDAPVSKFVLEMKGGKKSLLVNSRNICKAGSGRADVKMDGQNGKVNDFRPLLRNGCGGKGKKK
jgi:hypothetical protein